jgi:hypothetical protein
VGRITYEEQAWFVPARKAIGFDGKDRDLLPFLEVLYVFGKLWREFNYGLAQFFQAFGTHLLVAAFGDDIADLPSVETVDYDYDMANAEATKSFLWIARVTREFEPENVHGRRGFDWLEVGEAANA